MAIYVGSSQSSHVYLGSTAISSLYYGSQAATVTSTTGLVANRFQAPTTTSSVPANYTSRRQHYAHPDGAISNFKTVDCTFVLTGITPVQAATRTIKRYIEYPVDVFTQVTWAGSTSVTLSTSVVTSDVIPLTIPAGAIFWERTVNLGGTVSTFPVQEMPASSQTLGLADGNSASDLGNSGTIAATSTANTFGATAMIGTIAVANAKSFVVVGDSIAWGEGDISNVGSKGGNGWIGRALDSHGYPYVKIAKQGQQATDFTSATAPVTAFLSAINYTDAVCEFGINDLRLGRTQAQVLADHQTIYGVIGSGKRVYQTTLTPRSATTDAYATTTNQTAKTDGNMAALNALNASIRAIPANVNFVIDAADAAMSARDSGIWTAPPAATTDGTHPNSTKAASMGTTLAFP
jgi:lysophospholipase L1-like esterase